MTSHAIETAFPLTPLQQAVLLASVRSPEGSPYQVQCQVDLLGPLDTDLLAQAWRHLTLRHPALRSFFAWEGREEPLQVVRADAPIPWTVLDWSPLDGAEQEARWSSLRAQDAATPFDLAKAPIVRLTLVRLGAERHRLLWSLHHALADGWSGLQVIGEMLEEYEALRTGAPLDRPPPPSYGLFVSWLASRDRVAAEAYWTEQLRGLSDSSPLPGAHRSNPGPHRDTVELDLGPDLSEALARASTRFRVTPYTLLLAAWALVLDRHSPDGDSVTFGTTVTERPAEIPKVELAVGMYLNTVPLRLPAPGSAAIQDWLETIQATAMEARHHGVSGLGEITRWADLEPGAVLARSLVVYESFPDRIQSISEGDAVRLDNLRIHAPSDLPLALLGHPGESIRLELAFDTARYTPESALRLLKQTGRALRGLSRAGVSRVDQVDVLGPEERRTLVEEWSRSPLPDPAAPDVLDAFDSVVAKSPLAPAVQDENGVVSYEELDRAANRLAHRILSMELPEEGLLGVPAQPDASTVTVILACLKAGCGYVPFDPSQPQDRLDRILNKVQGVLAPATDERWGERRIVTTTGLHAEPASAPPVERRPDRTAYVIFTSGSTGHPKGVVVERGHLARSTAARLAWYERPPGRFLLLSSLAVDSSVAGFFWTLCTGGCLVVVPSRAEQDAAGLAGRIQESSIETTLLVPSLWRTLLEEVDATRLSSLRCVVVAGEACPPSLVALHHQKVPGARLVNEYGPSEATVWATAGDLIADSDPSGVTIGRPVPFTRVYLLDGAGRPVPVGAAGEICLGGETVARGYLDADPADDRRFVPDPFRSGGRMYRTGDRGRFRDDGRLDFLGRVDDQFKLRGYRVEPGEIEAVLDTAPGVLEAAVVFLTAEPAHGTEGLESGTAPDTVDQVDAPARSGELVAIVCSGDADTSEEELRRHVADRLPDYMVPRRFVSSPRLPRTSAGKLDRRALAAWLLEQSQGADGPGSVGSSEGGVTGAPSTEAERTLAGIFSAVLGLDRVSVHDDFFELGGDSLLSIRAIARATQAGLRIDPQQFFATPTISALAAVAEGAAGHGQGPGSGPNVGGPSPSRIRGEDSPGLPSRGDRRAPLSFGQRRFWFLDRLKPGDPAYNVAVRVDLRGTLDPDRLGRSYREVLGRHDALRAAVRLDGGDPWLDALPAERFSLERADFSDLPDPEAGVQSLSQEMARHRFDLLGSPLVRGVLARLAPDHHALLLTFQHMVLDAESLGLVLEDLGASYRQAEEAHSPGSRRKEAISYRDYAVWEQDRSTRPGGLSSSLQYWTERLSDIPERIEWPPDDREVGAAEGSGAAAEGATQARRLRGEVAEAIDGLARGSGCTPFVVLLAAYHVLLHRHSGQDVIVVGTPVGHRPHPDLERAVGYFQNLLPLRADFSGDPTFSELLTQLRDTVAEALARADVPFPQIVDAVARHRDPTTTPFLQTALTFHDATRPGSWRSALELPGLEVETTVLRNGGAKFEMALEIERTESGLTLLAEYAQELFGADAVSALLDRFEVLLRGALGSPERPISTLPVMTGEERGRSLGPWSVGSSTASTKGNDPHVQGSRVFVLDRRGQPVPPGVPGELGISGLPFAMGTPTEGDPAAGRLRRASFPEAAGTFVYHTGDRVRFRPDGTLAFLAPPHEEPGPVAAVEAVASDTSLTEAPPTDGMGRPMAPPEGPMESTIAAVWTEVLGTPAVGRHNDFFALGGHSLKAISVLLRLEEALGVELPLAGFFESPTVAGLAALVESMSPPTADVPPDPGLHDAPDGPHRYPLSPDQSRLWYLQQLDPESSAYNVPVAYRLVGRLDRSALQLALDDLVRRHDALRTTIDGSGDEPVQVVHAPRPVPITVTDFPQGTPESVIRRAVEEEATAPFDVEQGPLVRCRLLRHGEGEQHLVVTVHHLVADGWSMALMTRELSESYAATLAAAGSAETDADGDTRGGSGLVRWGPWCATQRERLDSGEHDGDLAFWKDRLRELPPLELPTDHPRPERSSYRGRTHAFRLPMDETQRLEDRFRAAGVTPFAGLLGAFKVLLHRYAGQTDLAVGTVVAGRTSVASEEMVGLFANTLVLRTELDPGWGVDDLLARISRNTVEALAHHRAPFATVVEAVQPPRDPSRNPLFQVAFLLQNQETAHLDLPGARATEVPVEMATAKFDLTLSARREEGGYAFHLEYATDLFLEATIEGMSRHLCALLAGMAEGFEGPISALPMVRDRTEWSVSGPVQAACGEPLHARVSAQARQTPDAMAVMAESGDSIDYRELDQRSDRIALALMDKGIHPGDVVGVGLPRTPDMVAALLGIMKAGAAYLPLDPDFPPSRLEHIVADAGAALLLTTASLRNRFPTDVPSVRLATLLGDDLSVMAEPPHHGSPGFPAVAPEALAYLIYTSGSTGGPKGVEVTHGNAVNLLGTMGRRPGLDGDTRWLAVTTLSFDISVLEIFGPLMFGGIVILASSATAADGRALKGLISRTRPTHLQATPSTWRMLLDLGWEGDGSLKALVGGEALPPELARELTDPCGEVWNMYGPTETTVWSTCGRVDEVEGPIQVGTPVANTTVHILDSALQPVPRGVSGELFIAGAGVAVGYRGRSDLTKERFLPDPFAENGVRMYRTGDRGRLRSDGTLEVLGRLDGQVKIRGFRIETGEVEAVLEEHPAVRQAVVQAFGTGTPDARLVAFIVSDPGQPVSGSEARRFVRERLPRYMVPSMISLLDALPLTPNGKVDRKALEDPLEAGRVEPTRYQPPASQAEQTIAEVWSDLLPGVRVGRGDNFFELGGHSLLSIRAVAEIRRRTGRELDARAFFFQTVEQLATGLEDDGGPR